MRLRFLTVFYRERAILGMDTYRLMHGYLYYIYGSEFIIHVVACIDQVHTITQTLPQNLHVFLKAQMFFNILTST